MARGGVFESLSSRDRKLLAGMVGFFALAAVAILGFTLKGWLDDKASRVRTAKDNLEVLVAMEERYLEAAQKIEASEARLRSRPAERLDAFVERVASQTSVRDNLSAVDQLGSEVVGGLQQTRYRVDLKKVQLASALDFLHTLETAGYPATVERATFQSVFVSGERMIDLTLELVVLDLKEGK